MLYDFKFTSVKNIYLIIHITEIIYIKQIIIDKQKKTNYSK